MNNWYFHGHLHFIRQIFYTTETLKRSSQQIPLEIAQDPAATKSIGTLLYAKQTTAEAHLLA
jgi:hypothetical protein